MRYSAETALSLGALTQQAFEEVVAEVTGRIAALDRLLVERGYAR